MTNELDRIKRAIAQARRDIETLKESLKWNQLNLDQRTAEEIQEIITHGAWILKEHDDLKRELERLLTELRKHEK